MKIFYAFSTFMIVAFAAMGQTGSLPASGGNHASKIIKFYPNPATTLINLEFQKDYDKNYSFQIYSFVGKKVLELNNLSPKTTVNLTDFYRGIYIFQLRDKNGKVIDSGKFQVAR